MTGRKGASSTPPHGARALGCACAIALLAAVGCGERQPPNVLLITLDTTRADHLGSYGHPGKLTPWMDAIARDGTLFERARSTSAATPISHASILTGLNPYRHGVRVISAASGFRLAEGIPTLATVLKENGYATAAVHSSFTVSGTFGLGAGFDHFDDMPAEMRPIGDGNFVEWDLAAFQRRADETSGRVISLLDRLEEPFFLWVHYWDPHDGWRMPPREFLRPGVARVRKPDDDLYAEEIRFMDQELGRVVDHLGERGLWDETITLITADHGQGLADGLAQHGWRGHRVLYRQQIDVPLILRGPGIEAGRRVAGLARSIDILPTLLDLLGIAPLRDIEGESLRALLAGEPDPHAPRMAYADQLNGYDWNARMVSRVPTADFLYSVSDGTWKLIYRPSRPEASELFHRGEDPEERVNRFAQEPEQVARLLADLGRRQPFVDRPFPAEEGGLTEAERQALIALGYVADPDDGAPVGPAWGWRCPAGGAIAAEPRTCADGSTPVMVALPASAASGVE